MFFCKTWAPEAGLAPWGEFPKISSRSFLSGNGVWGLSHLSRAPEELRDTQDHAAQSPRILNYESGAQGPGQAQAQGWGAMLGYLLSACLFCDRIDG